VGPLRTWRGHRDECGFSAEIEIDRGPWRQHFAILDSIYFEFGKLFSARFQPFIA
jgi:hypothetical protein